jgi:hypothetical protein
MTAYFNRFTITMTRQAALDCSHGGACDDDVAYWAKRLKVKASADDIRAELKEYGAWDADELADDDQNLHRIIWIAAGQIKEELHEQKTKLNYR